LKLSELTRREFFLSRRVFIDSRSEFKRAILTGQITVVVFVTMLIYLVLDLLWIRTEVYTIRVVFLLLVFGSYYLNRQGRSFMAKILLLIATISVISLFFASAPLHHGIFFFYFPMILSSFILFSRKQRISSFGFVLYMLALFYVGYWHRP
jgi:hypothetical protein